MTVSNNIKREALLKVANQVRPALATQDYIKALTHIRFDGEWATSFNDVTGIAVACDVDLDMCVPGDFLIKTLNSFSSENVAINQGKDGSIVLSSGKSKLKVPTLPSKDFPFQLPSLSKGHPIACTQSLWKGIERCLQAVGNDPTHPAQMGVTLDISEGCAVLYSTDNFTLSQAITKDEIELPGDAPVILPTFFCQQLVALAKAFPDDAVTLVLLPGGVVAKFGKKAKLFTKTVLDLVPLEFERVISKYYKAGTLKKKLAAVPDAMDAALARHLLVLGNVVDKVTTIEVDEEDMLLTSSSDMGEADDKVPNPFDGKLPVDKIKLDPTLVVRGLRLATHMAVLDNALALANEEATFVHLVAYVK